MPELAEVEAVRRRLEKELKGRKIQEVSFEEGDRFLFAHVPAETVRRALVGARVKGAGRKGKYFWLELDRKPWPIFHLGMSGNIALLHPGTQGHHEKSWGGAKLWSERGTGLPNRLWFCRLLLTFDRGREMAFTDPRRFGRMWLADDPWNHPAIQRLGFDPMIDFPSARALAPYLARRKNTIKAVLLDQKLFAGVGNWLADEILYQARISPRRLASSLTATEVRLLRASTLKVIRHAVKVGADYERFPKSWLFHVRWGKAKGARTARGKIIHEEIGGRTTAWVPKWQS